MITIRRLSKSFRQTKSLTECLRNPFQARKPLAVLKQITLTVEGGELFCLLGLNGAGKTTLLKILAGLILPEDGEIQMERPVGFLSGEERSFYWRLTGRQNLEFFASLYNFSYQESKKKIEELSLLFGLEEFLDRMFMKYSTGMRQKLAIARNFLNDPPVLLMDEPTRSLDPLAQQEFRRLIREQLIRKEGKTVLFTTHHLEEAERFPDRIGILHQGRLVAVGSLEELKERFHQKTLEEIFECCIKSPAS